MSRPLPEYFFPLLRDWPLAAPYAIAVSGGADSMALLRLMHEYAPTSTLAITVDHGLRPESAQEAAQVAAWCDALGISHHIIRLEALDASRNLQAHAREARYEALTGFCRERHASLLIAHHADDQAETVALQRHRGESPPSRAGMPLMRERDGIALWRPLLGVRKQALRDYLCALGQAWIEDPSNRDPRFARVQVREALSEIDITALWYEAQTMGEARAASELARNAWYHLHARYVSPALHLPYVSWQALDTDPQNDVLSHAIRVVGSKLHRPRLHETTRLSEAMQQDTSGKATLGGVIVAWNHARDAILLTPEPSHRMRLELGGNAPHIPKAELPKSLEVAPFWWFNPVPNF